MHLIRFVYSCELYLYAYVVERCMDISRNHDRIGFIVPLTISSNNNMKKVRDLIVQSGVVHFSHFETRPSRLFEGADQRLTIFMISQGMRKYSYSTSVLRWISERRENLFSTIYYGETFNDNRLWLMAADVENRVYKKFKMHKEISNRRRTDGSCAMQLWYRTAGVRYWIIFSNKGFGTESLSNKVSYFSSSAEAQFFMAALNSNLFWWYYAVNFDMFNLKNYMIFGFTLNYQQDSDMCKKAAELEHDMYKHREIQSVNRATLGKGETFVYRKKFSKPIIDEIDELLAKHYGFTEEELDFIINYDIKYRRGDQLNGGE